MACNRHSEYASHGEDLVMVQASHVGYDPEHNKCSNACGKISDTLEWYVNEYNFARHRILVDRHGEHCYLTIDSQYLLPNREQGLLLNLDKMIQQQGDGKIYPSSVTSTASTFLATTTFQKQMAHFFEMNQGPQPIGDALLPEYFSFTIGQYTGGSRQIEQNIVGVMPWIVTSEAPMLTAAQANTQAEFDRVSRSISQEPAYQNRNLLYISGLHLDMSPPEGQNVIVNKFIPWAAYIQMESGERYILEQDQLCKIFKTCKADNPDQLDFEKVIRAMENPGPAKALNRDIDLSKSKTYT
uniref:Uncharacterized protein n=1 Tax=uncultured Thiotrichaceae bacterium TaxID=298394 RepID=A0A6S6TUX4_9GAMM|nr:MAG: Unknown protein [uncultured Thiotrichaceae bacterium]